MIKAALSNQNDTQLLNIALFGVVGQTTMSGFVPPGTHTHKHPHHTHLLSWHILLQGRAKQCAPICSIGVRVYVCVGGGVGAGCVGWRVVGHGALSPIHHCHRRRALIPLCILEELRRQRECALVASPTLGVEQHPWPLEAALPAAIPKLLFRNLLALCEQMTHRRVI